MIYFIHFKHVQDYVVGDLKSVSSL